ncbi:TIGR03086 family metal-binding protein [Alloactinosynnema sp. L-07]|uniref:TIGR03086 family metal-binding protein n=1 Tax=Alloactinosynnema sp. L-07 TaxID=1653480 RepID=UPI0006B406AE|nr:TIGR03086 family metal-binding protein [Alloactinosynnema sp. L-07]
MDIRELDRRVLELIGGVIDGLTDEQFDVPTPCEGWTVREVIRHMVGNSLGVLARVGGTEAPAEVDLGVDPRATFRQTRADASAALSRPEVFDGPWELRGQQYTGGTMLFVHFADVLVHTWDIGTAVGIDIRFEDDLAQAALGVVSRFPEDAWGPGSAFIEKLPVADDASAQEKLLALTGRRVPSAA